MADSGSAGGTRDPFENIISLVAGPIAAVIRSFDQLRRGSDELFKGLENFNRTMANLNDTAERVNALLNEFEEPARAVLPQVLATARLAEDLATRVVRPDRPARPRTHAARRHAQLAGVHSRYRPTSAASSTRSTTSFAG